MKFIKFMAVMLAFCLAVLIPSVSLADSLSNPSSNSATPTVTVGNGNGANATPGPYDPNGVGEGDNQGNGNAPDNGTVGNADGKNPPGQLPGGNDSNNGYECDGNKGVGNNGGNPAHSGCVTPTPTKEASPEPTVVPTTPAPSASPSDSPKPTVTPTVTPTVSPSVTPTTPAPTASPTPTEPAVTCPGLSAVGRFANASGNEAVLTVTVNGEVRPFGLTAVDGTPLPGVFTVSATDFEFPGIIHLLDLNVGDVVEITLTDGRTVDSDSGVVRDSCGVGVEVGLDKFVGPVLPPVKPTPPATPTATPTVPADKPTPVCDAYSGGCVTPSAPDTPTLTVTPQSDGQTVTTLPYTGGAVKTLVVVALVLLVGGFLLTRLTRRR